MASFTFNGLNSETDYDLRIHDVLYNVLPQTIDRDVKVPYGRGRYDYGTYLDSNTIGFVCSLQGTSYADVFTQVEAIAAWLNPELGVFKLSYSGKPNRHCYAKISGNTSVKQILLYGKFTAIFKIPEGVWYGDEVNWTSNEATLEDEEVGSIFTTPSDMTEGAMKADLSGMTVTNLVDGDFDDTTGWTGKASALTASDNALLITGDGSTPTPRAYTTKALTSTSKYMISFSARVTASGATYILSLRYNGAFIEDLVTSPVANKWYRITRIVTGIDNLREYVIGHRYADATTANTKVMQVKDLNIVNLTAHGLDSITDTAVLDAMFPHYISGTVHAGATRFTSVGKNLFDGVLTKGQSIDVNGLYQPSPRRTSTTNYIKVTPSTAYNLSHNGYSGALIMYIVCEYSSSMVLIKRTVAILGAFTTDSATSFIRFTSYSGTYDMSTYANFQLELGSTATTYEPYHDTHTTGTLPELRRVPNDTRDTYDLNTGVKTQRVSDGVVVVGVVSVDTTNYPLSLNGGSFINVLDSGGMETGTIGTDSTSADGTLYYELATPVLTYIDPELKNQDDEAVNFLLGGPSYMVNIDIDGCPCPMTRYGTMEVIENDGGLSTEGVIEITCDFNTSFLEIKLDDSDEFIRIEDTFLINDVIEINLNTGSVTKNGTSILDKVTLASTLFDGTFKIPRGTSLLSLHGAAELTLVFEEKWL